MRGEYKMVEEEKCDIHGGEVPLPETTGKLHMITVMGWDKEGGCTDLKVCVECLKNKGNKIIEELEKKEFR